VSAPFRNTILYGFSSEGLEFDSRLCNIIIKLSENRKRSQNYCCSKVESKLSVYL